VCKALGKNHTKEDPVEPGSAQDVSRKFLRALGFNTMGAVAHLYRYNARYEMEKETTGERDGYGEDGSSKKRKRA